MTYTANDFDPFVPSDNCKLWCEEIVTNIDIQTHYSYLELIWMAIFFISIQFILFRFSKNISIVTKISEEKITGMIYRLSYFTIIVLFGFCILNKYY